MQTYRDTRTHAHTRLHLPLLCWYVIVGCVPLGPVATIQRGSARGPQDRDAQGQRATGLLHPGPHRSKRVAWKDERVDASAVSSTNADTHTLLDEDEDGDRDGDQEQGQVQDQGSEDTGPGEHKQLLAPSENNGSVLVNTSGWSSLQSLAVGNDDHASGGGGIGGGSSTAVAVAAAVNGEGAVRSGDGFDRGIAKVDLDGDGDGSAGDGRGGNAGDMVMAMGSSAMTPEVARRVSRYVNSLPAWRLRVAVAQGDFLAVAQVKLAVSAALCAWCGVLWCGVVWYGMVWCGAVWCGVVWCGVVWCGVVWCDVMWCGVVWCNVAASLECGYAFYTRKDPMNN